MIVERTGEYKGFVYEVVINEESGFRCGCVLIPKGHKLHGVDYRNLENIDCHGGLTFSGDDLDSGKWYIGFDCGHFGDGVDFDLISNKQTREIKRQFATSYDLCCVRSCEFVIVECIKIIDQIIKEIS